MKGFFVLRVKKIHFIFSIALVFIFFSSGLYGNSFEVILKDLENLQSLQMDFKQTVFIDTNSTRWKRFKGQDGKLINTGRASFRQPDWFKWEKKEPEIETIAYFGEDLMVFVPRESILYRYGAKGSRASEILSISKWLTNPRTLGDYFNIKVMDFDKKQAHLELTPNKNTPSIIKKIGVTINRNKKFIASLDVYTQQTNEPEKRTLYEFSSPIKNSISQKNARAFFMIDVPKGTRTVLFDQ